MPEARIILAEAVVHVATAPKSNASYAAVDAAIADVRAGRVGLGAARTCATPTTPGRERLGHGAGYRYAHDEPHAVAAQQYVPDELAAPGTTPSPTGGTSARSPAGWRGSARSSTGPADEPRRPGRRDPPGRRAPTLIRPAGVPRSARPRVRRPCHPAGVARPLATPDRPAARSTRPPRPPPSSGADLAIVAVPRRMRAKTAIRVEGESGPPDERAALRPVR